MKKVLTTSSLLAMLLAMLSFGVATHAQDTMAKTMTWTGWISNSACGAKDANAEGKDCTAKCVKDKGASYVFVDTKTKKVSKIHNQDAVTDANLGQEVKVTGHRVEGGEIHVDSIANAGM